MCWLSNQCVCFSCWNVSELRAYHSFLNPSILLDILINVIGYINQSNYLYFKPIPYLKVMSLGLPRWHSGLESTCRCRGHGFNPWSGKIPHAAEQLNPCATTTEPVCHNYWSPRAEGPCSTREATAVRSLHTPMRSNPRSPQLEKAHAQQRRPTHSKAAKNKLKFK